MGGPLLVCHQPNMFPNLVYFVHSIQFYFEIRRFKLERKIEYRFFICIISHYPYPRYFFQTPSKLDLYSHVEERKLKSVDVKFQVEVGYWAYIDRLQDYKIYGTLIKMFKPEFLSSLRQPLGDNPWPINLTNKNFKT